MTAFDPSKTFVPVVLSGWWTCAFCSTVVQNGCVHYCSIKSVPNYVPTNSFSTPPHLSDTDVDRIARRIVELMKESGDGV